MWQRSSEGSEETARGPCEGGEGPVEKQCEGSSAVAEGSAALPLGWWAGRLALNCLQAGGHVG